jgi:hypothetical protein
VANVREEFPWFLLEPQRGVFDWRRSDAIFAAARSVGVSLNPVLVFSPSWAASGTTIAPTPADFSAFVTAFARRYDADLTRPYAALEMWNEPDHGHYWNSGEAAYIIDILTPGYNAAKAVDAHIMVEMGAPVNDSGACCTWLDGLLNAGAPFDIAAYHNYVGSSTQEASAYAQHLAGKRNVPIWLGEYGAQETGTNDPNQQSLFTGVLTSAAPLAVAQWYNLRDDNAVNCCPPVTASSAAWGLVLHDDVTLKQGFGAMQTLLAGVSGAPPPAAPPTQAPTPTGTPSPTSTPTPTPSAPARPPGGGPTPTPTVQPSPSGTLFSDDFSDDAPGTVPGGWSVAGDTNAGWAVTGEAGRHRYAHNGDSSSTLAGSSTWSNYTLSVDVRPSAWQSESSGIDVRAIDAKDHYTLRFIGGSTLAFSRVVDDGSWGGSWTKLSSAAFSYSGSVYHVAISAIGDRFTVVIDGEQMLDVRDATIARGGIGFDAHSPIDFASVGVVSR